MEARIIDLSQANDKGVMTFASFWRLMEKHPPENYKGTQIILTGRAPTWAYLLAYERFRPVASRIDFHSPRDGQIKIYEAK